MIAMFTFHTPEIMDTIETILGLALHLYLIHLLFNKIRKGIG